MDFSTEVIHGHYLVSSGTNGAMSLFSPSEYLAFHYIVDATEKDRRDILRSVLSGFGCNEEKINSFSDIFLRKLTQQGWFRDGINDAETEKISIVYFSVTTACNLSCIYCYIGDDRRQPDHVMDFDHVATILEKIRDFNPSARISVTGGEPFTHPRIFDILDTIELFGLKFTLGTNAILVDDLCAERLKQYKNLLFVQASLDGMTPEVHAITRGESWQESMNGIRKLIEYQVPFAIAPTIHERNLHEIYDIGYFAYSNGGFFAPNHLRKFPHAPHVLDISLTPESLRNCIIETFGKLEKKFNPDVQPAEIKVMEYDGLADTRCRYVCGNAGYTTDIDWNGDVYPCHLLREKQFILGNILTDDFRIILENGSKSETRVKSYTIPKCSHCPFMSTCAGGCRASAYYTKGTFAAEDEFCEILYKFEIDKLFLNKGIR